MPHSNSHSQGSLTLKLIPAMRSVILGKLFNLAVSPCLRVLYVDNYSTCLSGLLVGIK